MNIHAESVESANVLNGHKLGQANRQRLVDNQINSNFNDHRKEWSHAQNSSLNGNSSVPPHMQLGNDGNIYK